MQHKLQKSNSISFVKNGSNTLLSNPKSYHFTKEISLIQKKNYEKKDSTHSNHNSNTNAYTIDSNTSFRAECVKSK